MMNVVVKQQKRPRRGQPRSSTSKSRILKDTTPAILKSVPESESESVSTEPGFEIRPHLRLDMTYAEIDAAMTQYRREEGQKLWDELTEHSGEPCPMPLEEFDRLGPWKAMEYIQKMQFEPLNRPGTPECEALLADIREMAKYDKTPRFKPFLDTFEWTRHAGTQ